jgi:O6-methylguanine-DNA--protein-cysteine methyltransferase
MIYFTRFDSPIGTLLLIGNGTILRGIYFDTYQRKPTIDPTWLKDSTPFATVIQQLRQYFAGQRQHFDIPFAYEGTPFQRQVWDVLQDHSLWPSVDLSTASARHAPSRRRTSYGQQSHRDYRPLP